MTVREVPAAQTGRGEHPQRVRCFQEFSTFFNSRKAGSRSSPPFLCVTFSAVFMAAVFGSPPLLQFFPQYVKLLWIKAVQISHIVV